MNKCAVPRDVLEEQSWCGQWTLWALELLRHIQAMQKQSNNNKFLSYAVLTSYIG